MFGMIVCGWYIAMDIKLNGDVEAEYAGMRALECRRNVTECRKVHDRI